MTSSSTPTHRPLAAATPLATSHWPLLALLLLLLAGCSSTGESTRLRGEDFEVTTQEMVNSLAASSFLTERTPDSPAAYIVINKVENLTTDVITPSEQWMLMARVQGSLPVQQLNKKKNIHFLIPPERKPLLDEAGYNGPLETGALTATHTLTATFRSSPRTVRDSDNNVDRREDWYYLEYKLFDIRTRELIWTDKFEFKREAKGLSID